MSRNWCRSLLAVAAGVMALASTGWSRPSEVPRQDARTQASPRAGVTVAPAIRVLVDPRVELMCIVFRLAGHPEYSMGTVRSYAADVDTYFAPFKDHPVVVRARQLRKTRGISLNAPMSLAVHVTLPPELAEQVPFNPLPPEIDPRWTTSEARAFLAELRSFVRQVHAMEFLASHAPLYQAATERLVMMTSKTRIVEWLEGFFGRREGRTFVLIAGLLNGGGNYGAQTRGEFFSIVGTESIDEDGLPSYPPGVAATVVHEFCHSFINPLVDAHEAELKAVTDRLYQLVQEQMRSQGYGVPRALMYESLVRGCTVRYLSKNASAAAARREAEQDRRNGFAWVGRLADALVESRGTGRVPDAGRLRAAAGYLLRGLQPDRA